MDNIVIEVEDKKSLLIQEESNNIRLRNIFHVNEMMGGNYWLMDKNNIKFKLNLNQLKVLKIAMAMVNPKEKIDDTKPPISYTFTIDKLLEIMGEDNGRLRYTDMPSFLTDLTASDNFNYRDKKGNLVLVHIFDKVIYKPEKQEVTFRFSWSMLEDFLTIDNKENGEYQSYTLGNIMEFQSLYTINFYELCKVRLKGVKQRNFEIDILDLKIALDLYDPNNQKEQKYERYCDFKKYILNKVIEEINGTKGIDIKVAFMERKKGRTVVALVIQIENIKYKTKTIIQDKNIEEEVIADVDYESEESDFIKKAKEIITENLDEKSLKTIYKVSKGNLELLKEKYNEAKESNSDIFNLGGWLVNALKEKNVVRTIIKKNKHNFTDYEQREYNFDNLEKMFNGEMEYDPNLILKTNE
jgi:hypothetical protein